MKIEVLIPLGVAALAIIRVYFGIKTSTPTKNPWDDEVENSLNEPEARPVCYRCLCVQENSDWFCPECRAATGPYNNLMPYLYIFSQGEMLRTGTSARFRRNVLTIGGFIACSLGSYFIFAPIYWYFLFKNLGEQKTEITSYSTEPI